MLLARSLYRGCQAAQMTRPETVAAAAVETDLRAGPTVHQSSTEDPFTGWKRREEIAEAMIPMIGRLYRERDVTILVHSRSLVNKSVISILKTHRFVRQIEEAEL